jgi:hypothetical protein
MLPLAVALSFTKASRFLPWDSFGQRPWQLPIAAASSVQSSVCSSPDFSLLYEGRAIAKSRILIFTSSAEFHQKELLA